MSEKEVEKMIKETIYKFINPKNYMVFIFGSRANGKASKYSDFDIGIMGKKSVPIKVLNSIEEILEDSDLPFNIDVVDFSKTTKKFQDVALLKTKKI